MQQPDAAICVLVVAQMIPGSVAGESAIKAYDMITGVNGKSLLGKPLFFAC